MEANRSSGLANQDAVYMFESEPAPPPSAPHRRRVRRAPPGFITIGALASAASIPRSTLYHLVRARRLPAFCWRAHLVIPEAAVTELLAVRPLGGHAPAGDADAITSGGDHA